jgi:hypothetical protein
MVSLLGLPAPRADRLAVIAIGLVLTMARQMGLLHLCDNLARWHKIYAHDGEISVTKVIDTGLALTASAVGTWLAAPGLPRTA